MVKNTKYGLAGLLLGAALSVFSGGCTEEEATIGRAFGALATASPNTTLNEKAWGYAIKEGSEAELDSINAEKSATRVNVNVNTTNRRTGRSRVLEKYFMITDVKGRSVIVPGLKGRAYVNEHKERYEKGYKIEYFENHGKWQGTSYFGEMNPYSK